MENEEGPVVYLRGSWYFLVENQYDLYGPFETRREAFDGLAAYHKRINQPPIGDIGEEDRDGE